MENFETLSTALDALRNMGYTEDFNLSHACLECRSGSIQVHPEDFQVDHYYRFEGMTDPSDESVLYAISSEKHGLKGTLVNGYGISSDPLTDAMMARLHF
ncbi:MAG: phosphoribosylpyrophosphate synthetase [Bacteroidetes bacterium]|nr:phosphoribosylpyrophosphate synthetase [Bacteroidota bacterium]